MADIALQADNSKLAFYALEFLYRWIARGDNARPPILLSVDEGLVVSALGAAGRTYSSTLLDAAWSTLRRSLRQKRAPNPETYLSKIYAFASLGNLQRAFLALKEFETVYGNSEDTDPELFSPFTSLYPLVVACCRNGFSTLDSVFPDFFPRKFLTSLPHNSYLEFFTIRNSYDSCSVFSCSIGGVFKSGINIGTSDCRIMIFLAVVSYLFRTALIPRRFYWEKENPPVSWNGL